MDALTQNIIGDLRELIRVKSVEEAPLPGKPFGAGCRAALDLFLKRASGYGLAVKNADGYAGHIEYGDGGKIAAALVHLDTVSASPADWTHPPYGGEIADGKIYGRGAADNKGAAVVMLHVLKKLKEDGIKLKNKIRVIAGCDEESGSECVKYYFKKEAMPDFAFSPDADFPLINAEKHIIHLEIKMNAGALFKRLLPFKAGTASNVVPDAAAAEFKDGGSLSVRGRAAHSMECFKGDNAIVKLIAELRAKFPDVEDEAADFLIKCGRPYGEGLGIKCDDGKTGFLTCNLSLLEYHDKIKATVDIRCPVGFKIDEITERANRALPSGAVLKKVRADAGYALSPSDPLAVALLDAYTGVTGEAAAPRASGGGTYARYLRRGAAFGPMFPGTAYNIHGADEAVPLDQIRTLFDIYYRATVNIGNL